MTAISVDGLPLFIFMALIFIDFALILYAFIDSENRAYGNVFASFISAILSYWLALMVTGERVTSVVVSTMNETNISDKDITTHVYEHIPIYYQIPGLGMFFTIIGVVMTILFIVFILEVATDVFGMGEDEEEEDKE